VLGEQANSDWQQAALRVGEELATSGPDGYYAMTPAQWRDWALNEIARLKQALDLLANEILEEGELE
jgi:hypothetical protein